QPSTPGAGLVATGHSDIVGPSSYSSFPCLFLQADDGIRAFHVTGVQTCALPIFAPNTVNVRGPSRKMRLREEPWRRRASVTSIHDSHRTDGASPMSRIAARISTR